MTTPGDASGSQPAQAPLPEPPSPLPPARPAWAAPPEYEPQQTWGSSPPGRTDKWGEPGWAAKPERMSHTKRNGCLIGCGAAVLLVIALVVLLIVEAGQVLAPALDVSTKIQQNSHGQVISASYSSDNGVGDFRVTLALGTTASQARDIACGVVRPALRGSQFDGDRFEVLDTAGQILADDTTPCG
jgi:hypothetical protein